MSYMNFKRTSEVLLELPVTNFEIEVRLNLMWKRMDYIGGLLFVCFFFFFFLIFYCLECT